MSVRAGQSGSTDARSVIVERCRDLGLAVLRCSVEGRLERNDPSTGVSAHFDSWARSGYITSLLHPHIQRWNDEDSPSPALLFEGCWAIPLPEMRRRRRTGYTVCVALSPEAVSGEEFAAACQSARLDLEAMREALAARAVFTRGSVEAAAKLLGWSQQDRVALSSGEEAVGGFSQQLTEAYEEMSLLYKLGQSMNELTHPKKFVRMMCDELYATLGFGWIAAWFVDDPSHSRHLAGRCIVSGDAVLSPQELAGVVRQMSGRIDSAGPTVLDPEDDDALRVSRTSAQLLVHPVSREGRLIGALLAGDKGENAQVTSVDMKMLEAASAHLRVLLENAALYDDQQAMFVGTLRALTAAIDAKDRYTRGHSERVALMASRLAAAMGMDEDTVKRVHICGLVHDVGKIGVPEAVLCKTGRLTDEEFQFIKAHPEIGHHILHDIPQLEDILPGVLSHHERWDGRGYPHGLAGEDIPLFGRIVALADSFDAMSSNRTYRSALPRAQVLEEIRRCAGAQFDPEMAPVFASLDFSEFDRVVAQHQATDTTRRPNWISEEAA
ncbi:MAG: HD-GYP domain-containing protein [Planctomycetota bacterium]|nr:HD-GYP domain-containing protein [Planctomycetota bacterium]